MNHTSPNGSKNTYVGYSPHTKMDGKRSFGRCLYAVPSIQPDTLHTTLKALAINTLPSFRSQKFREGLAHWIFLIFTRFWAIVSQELENMIVRLVCVYALCSEEFIDSSKVKQSWRSLWPFGPGLSTAGHKVSSHDIPNVFFFPQSPPLQALMLLPHGFKRWPSLLSAQNQTVLGM